MRKPHRLTRRGFLGCAVGAAMALGAAGRRAVGQEAVLDIGSEPQSFLDDWIVDRMEGLSRTLHQPEKKGLIQEADGRDWERGGVYPGNSVYRDARGRFHMIYLYLWWDPGVRDLHPYIGEDRAHWFRSATAYATSTDGIRWEKPRIGLIEGPTGFRRVEGFPFEEPIGLSKDNNLGCPIDFVRDLRACGNVNDPARRLLLRATRKEGTHPFAGTLEAEAFFAAEWPDLAHDPDWRGRLTPIEGAQLSPRGCIAGFDGEWFAVGQDEPTAWRARGGRDIVRVSSPDLVRWCDPEVVLPIAEDESKDPSDYVEYMDIAAHRVGGPKSGLWLGQLVVFHGDRTSDRYMMPDPGGSPEPTNVWRKGTTEVRLVTSRDAGRSWRRVCGKQVWLPCHPEDNGYDRLVFAANPVDIGDETWFYYSCWDGDHLCFNRDGSTFYRDRMRINRTARAVLRRDGYVSLDARGAGTLVTKPLRFEGSRLLVNVAAPQGLLQVELRDDSDRPLPGFSAEECRPLTGNGVDLPVRWGEGPVALPAAGTPVRLAFHLQNAALYGFRFASGSRPKHAA